MNVAIIGCGYWGPNLVRNFVSLDGCDRVFCCDTDSERLVRIRNLHPQVTTTTELSDILEDPSIDAVVVATPVVTHFDVARRALQAGKHVLVEKPLAASTQECEALVEIADAGSSILMVAHTFEYSVALNKAKEIIDRGDLGIIHYVSIQRLNLGPYRPDVNVLWDLAAHDVSILLYLLEGQPTGVNAQAQAFLRTGHADVATAMVHFDNGAVAFLHDSWLDPHKVRRVTVVGSRKMLVYDDVSMNEKIKIFDKGIDAPAEHDTYADFHFSYRYGDIQSPRIEEKEPLRVQCEHFLQCIKDGSVPRSDGRSGTRVVELLEAMTESIRQKGGFVALPQVSASAEEPIELEAQPRLAASGH
ncbi:MAG: Gfo/Idh/MocA family oxidoreductase [Gemmatimonadota bacterium]|nr:Gfo/Idh/MocA family oxidoreductase [Gemmatimonadota bacterium]